MYESNSSSATNEKVTNLDHVLDPTVRVLLNDRLDPDQGLHLKREKKTHVSTMIFTCTQSAGLDNIWHSHHLVGMGCYCD